MLEQIPKHLIKKIEIIICITLIISVIYNFYGSLAINHEKSHFSNLHYAAQFALTTSFILTYCLLKGKRPVNYVILLCCLLACGWILINTLSRPAWIALVLTVGCALVLFFNRKHALFGIAGLTIISILLYLLLPDFFSNRVDDLIENIKTEERVQIWSDALTMQASNNIGSWLIGHGPGSYETFFRAYNNFQAKINFPHNFILEILFESGIVGLTLITLLYQKLYASIFRMHKQQPKLRPESMLMFMCITANLILSFLTFPFYSKYVLLYQAPFMAITLYLSHTNPTPQKPLE